MSLPAPNATKSLLLSRSTRSSFRQTSIPTWTYNYSALAMAKRKSLSSATQGPATFDYDPAPAPKRRASQRKVSQPKPDTGSTNPDKNANVLDGPEALRASPDATERDERFNLEEAGMDVEKQVKEEENDSPLSEMSEVEPPVETKKGKSKGKIASVWEEIDDKSKRKPTAAAKGTKAPTKEPQFLDPEAEGDEEADEEEIQAALSRPPPVHSDYLPLPWKGRLGYVRVSIPSHRNFTDYIRLAYAHTSAFRIRLSSAREPAVLPQS